MGGKRDKRMNSLDAKHQSQCPKCNVDVDEDSKAIHCDLCQMWFHAACLNLDDASYKVVAALDQLYLCPTCLPLGKRFFALEHKQLDIEKRFSCLETSINMKLDQLAKQIGAQNMVALKNPPPADIDMNKIVVSAVKDALEADSKKTTVVLENFETTDDDANFEYDVKRLATTAGFDAAKIVSVRRSGPVIKSRRNGVDLPRIVKVKCDSESSRADLIRVVTKFADHGKKSKVYARPDRTWQQREALRNLNVELAEKRDAGETDWFIDRNMYQLKQFVQKPYVKRMPRP